MRLTTCLKILFCFVCIGFFAGCTSFPSGETLERCQVDLLNNVCNCHLYEVSGDRIGRVTDTREESFAYCDNRVSFSPADWGKFVLMWNKVIEYKKSKEKK